MVFFKISECIDLLTMLQHILILLVSLFPGISLGSVVLLSFLMGSSKVLLRSNLIGNLIAMIKNIEDGEINMPRGVGLIYVQRRYPIYGNCIHNMFPKLINGSAIMDIFLLLR